MWHHDDTWDAPERSRIEDAWCFLYYLLSNLLYPYLLLSGLLFNFVFLILLFDKVVH